MLKSIFLLFFLLSTTCLYSEQVYWSDTLIAYSSEYHWDNNPFAFKAVQSLGKPNVMPGQNLYSEASWMPLSENRGQEFLQVGFRNPSYATQIIINENLNPGAIISIDIFDERDELMFNLSEKSGFKKNDSLLPLILKFNRTKGKISSIKLTLNTALVNGFNQIDAIGISSDYTDYDIRPNLVAGTEILNTKERLNSNINSATDELVPQITPDGKTLYFTRDNHPQNFGYSNGNGQQDIWFSRMDAQNNFELPQKMDKPINNEMNNSICSITPDGQSILLLNGYLPDGTMTNGVSISKKDAEKWSFPQRLNIKNFYNNNKYGEYALSASGRILILAIQRNATYGGKDLYVSYRDADNNWSEPKNMGSVINTVCNEVSPFLAADEKTLYYSSSGFVGYGSYDIYLTRRLDESWLNWSEPQNLGPNINTTLFDAYYSITASGEYAYFSSGTNDNGTDLFRIKLPQNARPKPVVLVKGHVLNSKNNTPVAAKIYYESLTTGKEMGEANSDAVNGYYSIALPAGERYGYRANVPGFASINQNIDLINLHEYAEIEKDLYLVPIEEGNIIRLNNVFFDYGKAELRPETHLELDRLITLLNEKPSMKIEISGHTDNIGSDYFNKQLSRNRAKAVFDYLVANSISEDRLSFKGYGKDKPLKSNDSEAGRQENRRVELKIIKI